MAKILSLLTIGMFSYETKQIKKVVHPRVEALQDKLNEGQCLRDDFFHNAGWYNKLGEKIGWGDLSASMIESLPSLLPAGEAFVVLSEGDSHWDLPKGMDRARPGVDYIVQKAMAVVTSEGVFVPPQRYDSGPPKAHMSKTTLRGAVAALSVNREWVKATLEAPAPADRTHARFSVRQAIDAYRGDKLADTDQAALRDLLTDLMHFAESEGLDFDKARRGAKDVYREEKDLESTH